MSGRFLENLTFYVNLIIQEHLLMYFQVAISLIHCQTKAIEILY